jgi:membrane protein required for colicin V production
MFNIFDIITLTIFILSSCLGFYRGFLYITLDILGIILSIALTILAAPYLKNYSALYIKHELANMIVLNIALYLISSIIISLIFVKLVALSHNLRKSIWDKILGLMTGVIRGVFFNLVIFSVTSIFVTNAYLKSNNFKEMLEYASKKDHPIWLNSALTKPYLEEIQLYFLKKISGEYFYSVKAKNDKELVKEKKEIESSSHILTE